MFDGKINLGNTGIPGFTEESAFAKICPNLTFKQRVMGFCACAGIGWLLSFIGTLTLIGGPTPANITTFAVLYVMGNIIALCATGFLLGPKSQCNKMWHPTRRYTTGFYLVMLIIVFSVAVAKVNVGIVIALLIVQVCAGVWYSASYVPFGRKIILGFMRQVPCFKPFFDMYDQHMANKKAQGGIGGGGSGGDEESGGGGGMTISGFKMLSQSSKG